MTALIVLLLEIIFLGIVKLIGVLNIGDMVASLMIIAFSVTFVISVQNSKSIGRYTEQIVSGYLLRIAILYFDLFGKKIHVLPQSGNDSAMFYRASTELVLYGKTNREGNFIILMSKVFGIIGINQLFGQFLLMLMSVLAIILFLRTVEKLSADKQSKERIAWIINLLPNFALLSSLFLRESIVVLLITISACSIVEWMLNNGGLFFILAVISSSIACLLHSGSIGITIGYVICLLIYDNQEKRIHATAGGIIFAVIFALGISFVFLRYGDALMGKFMGVESIADIANTNQLGGSSYSRFVGNSNTPINMVIFTLPRIVYFLFSPFPWQWRGLSDIIAFLFSSLYYVFVIYNSIRFIFNKENKNTGMVIALFIVAFFCTFIFAWGVSNTGTASRHRDKMVCLYGLIYAITLNKSRRDSSRLSLYLRH